MSFYILSTLLPTLLDTRSDRVEVMHGLKDIE